VSSVVHDDVGGGFVVGACAVTECVGTGEAGVALVHESPVGADMPFDASRSLSAAALSAIVEDDVGGGAVANDVIKATNTSFSVSLSIAAALSAVVHDDVRGGVVVAANDVIIGVATAVTGVTWVHESPVDADMPPAASLSLAAAVWSVVDNTVAIGVTGAAVVHVSPVNTHVPSSASVSLAAAVTSDVSDDVGGGVIVGY